MAKSVKKELVDLSELLTIVGLARKDLVCIRVYGYLSEPEVMVEAMELARISRQLEVPRKKITIDRTDKGNIHIDFKARGVLWSAVVLVDEVEQFMSIVEAATPRLTVQPKRLSAVPRNLPFMEATP